MKTSIKDGAFFDTALHNKDMVTLENFMQEVIAKMTRTDLTLTLNIGDDPTLETSCLVNCPNGIEVSRDGVHIYDVYFPTNNKETFQDAWLFSDPEGEGSDWIDLCEDPADLIAKHFDNIKR